MAKKDGLMTRCDWRRAVAVGLAVLLVQGCATVPHEGESGFSLLGNGIVSG